MPKLGIYVPDDLWTRAKQAHPDKQGSAVVQEALRRMLNPDSRPAFVGTAPTVEEPRMASIASRLSIEADRDYARGYAQAVKMMEPPRTTSNLDSAPPTDELNSDVALDAQPVIGWELLDLFRSADWNVETWLSLMKERYGEIPDEIWDDLSYFSDVSGPTGLESTAFLAGVAAACRDAWSMVVKGVERAEV